MNTPSSPAKTPAFERAGAALRAVAMAYPETREDHPWGESAFKVKGKVFLFMSTHDGRFSTSTKLPFSATIALMLPFAEPTGYGLGKSGWVSARFGADDDIPLDILEAWVDESFRAVAPQKLVATLPSPGGAPAPSKKPATAKKPAAAKKPATAKKPAAAKKKPAAKKPPAAEKKPPAAKKALPTRSASSAGRRAAPGAK